MGLRGLCPSGNIPTGIVEYWNTGMMGSGIGITLIEVGGASACGGLEAESQEYFALCLSEVILKRSAPEPKVTLFPIFIRIIPLIQHSIIPCGWHKPIALTDNGALQKPRKSSVFFIDSMGKIL